MVAYEDSNKKLQKALNSLPLRFAFSDDQSAKMMRKWGMNPGKKDKVINIDVGGYIQKKDVDAYKEMDSGHLRERKSTISADGTGDRFIFHLFHIEPRNHVFAWMMAEELANGGII